MVSLLALTKGQKIALATLGIGGAVAALCYFIVKKPPPPPPPPGKGALDVHAYYDSVVVTATVEIVELEKSYTTPFRVDLDPGDYTLNATYADVTKTEVATVKAEETTTVNFRFVAAVSYYVNVIVDDNRGLRVEGAEVLIDGISVGFTDASGLLETLQEVSPGSHTFRAKKSGYTPAQKSVDVQDDMDLRLTLTWIVVTYTVTVTAKDADTGAGIYHAAVWLNGRGGYTGSNGVIVIRDVPERDYRLSAAKTGYYPEYMDVSVTKDMSITLYLKRVPPEKARVRIVAMRDALWPLSGAKVTMNGYSGITDGGHVDFYDVPFGTYTVTASKTGFTTASKTVVVNEPYETFTIRLYATTSYGRPVHTQPCQVCGAPIEVSPPDSEVYCPTCGSEYEVVVHGARA